jgi:oligopeptide transport system substrate-binding protein
VLGTLLLVLGLALTGTGMVPTAVAAAARDSVTIVSGEPQTVDPNLAGDVGSARVSAQLFESLTALDPGLNVRPALAESWQVLDGGRRVVFTMRPGLTFSDGSPLTADDVVRSWRRIVDPAAPSPLASLMADVTGATAFLRRTSTDPQTIGVRAVDGTVEVLLDRPVGADLPAIVAGPTFAVVPAAVGRDASALEAGPGFVASGGYRLTAATADELTLTANDHYWAGRPAIPTVHLKTSLGGASPVDAFEKGSVDYTPIGEADAAWIRYDPKLGATLRSVPSAAVTYYGFDTRVKPFDDPRVRQAFAWAVDWKRIVTLGSDGSTVPATSMVPPGIPGRSDRDFSPRHDPEAARAALAAAGYPGGVGFPEVVLMTGGLGSDEAVVAELKRELGVTVRPEAMGAGYFERLAADPPAMWALSWIADYPGPNDFLGLLLGSDSTSNYGHWSSPTFDAAIARAGAAADPTAARAAYDEAETAVQAEAPVIPLSYDSGFALARDGLLGASESGLGILRLAGLAWGPGS